jgi:hypothetical protein
MTELEIDIKMAIEAAEIMSKRLKQAVVITPDLKVVLSEHYCGDYLERVNYI